MIATNKEKAERNKTKNLANKDYRKRNKERIAARKKSNSKIKNALRKATPILADKLDAQLKINEDLTIVVRDLIDNLEENNVAIPSEVTNILLTLDKESEQDEQK